jgi:hypothetical protein
MGYAAKPIRQRVIFHPYIAAFSNQFSYRIVNVLSKWMPADRRLSKAKGMLRLWLSEKSPCRMGLHSSAAIAEDVESSSSSL